MNNHQVNVKYVSLITILSSLAIMITYLKIELPYPLIPYLKFDFAEIPSMLTLFLCDLKSSLIVATIHFLVLLYRGSFSPIGPLMKYTAVCCTLIGFSIGYNKSTSKLRNLIYHIMKALSLRVLVMSFMNYLIIVILFPHFLNFTILFLKKILGNFIFINELTTILLFTALYNALHTILTITLSYLIYKRVHRFIS